MAKVLGADELKWTKIIFAIFITFVYVVPL
jgi:hypothetical protein